MQRSPSPTFIGGFIALALALIVGMVLFFGTTQFLNRSTQFILFFDQSVNGLQVGSPVKFRGVPVGEVSRIMIRAQGQREDSSAIPVIIQINQSRLEQDLGVSDGVLDASSIDDAVQRGLVGRLNLESFITGQLFVEFSFEPESVGRGEAHLAQANGIFEIPTVSSSLDQITEDAAQIIADFKELDLGELNDNINALLVSARTVLDSIDAEAIGVSVSRAADGVSEVLASPEFRKILVSTNEALGEIQAAAQSFNLESGPLAPRLTAWSAQMTETLKGLDRLSAEASALIQPGSDLRYELDSMLRELRRAARSIRLLSEYLERNPNAILTGRGDDE
jgi:paraquat-inducible protein B